MRPFRLLLASSSMLLLGATSLGLWAAETGIRVTSVAETEVEVIDRDGNKLIKRSSLDRALPGTEVIFTNSYENLGGKAARDIVIDNPIPRDTAYKAGSAFGKDKLIAFSADGGKTFGNPASLTVRAADGRPRIAQPDEYTHIRWTHQGQLAAGKSGEVGFRAVVR